MPISAQFMLVMIPRIRWVQRVVWDRWPSTPVYLLGVPTAPGRLSAAARDRLEQNILAAFGVACEARGEAAAGGHVHWRFSNNYTDGVSGVGGDESRAAVWPLDTQHIVMDHKRGSM